MLFNYMFIELIQSSYTDSSMYCWGRHINKAGSCARRTQSVNFAPANSHNIIARMRLRVCARRQNSRHTQFAYFVSASVLFRNKQCRIHYVLSLKIYISFLSRLAQRQRRHGKVLYTLAAVWESAAGGKKQRGKASHRNCAFHRA